MLDQVGAEEAENQFPDAPVPEVEEMTAIIEGETLHPLGAAEAARLLFPFEDLTTGAKITGGAEAGQSRPHNDDTFIHFFVSLVVKLKDTL
jgi:hypothetical protein